MSAETHHTGERTASELVPILAGIAIVGYVVGHQLMGQHVRGKRLILLPALLTVIGATDLGSVKGHHPGLADLICLVIGGLLAAGIGLAQGRALRLTSRDGALWAQLPVKGLWLWLALLASRVVMIAVAYGVDAKVAASSATILLMLGINRLAQAVVVVPRSIAAGIPFAREKDGTVFLANLTSQWTNSNGTVRPPAPPTDQ